MIVARPPNDGLAARIFEEAIKGRSVAKIAELLDVDATTVRAAMREGDFRAQVAAHRAEVTEATLAKLHVQAELAVVQLGAVMSGKVKGTGAGAVVRAAEAVLDRIGVPRRPQLSRDDEEATEQQRVINVLVQVISQHPEIKDEAMRAIEATIATESEH